MNKLTIFLRTLRRSFFSKDTFMIFAVASLFYLVFYALPYNNQVLVNIPTAIVNMDNSQHALSLVRKIESASTIKAVLKTQDFAQAQKAYERSLADVIIVIPPDYAKDAASGRPTAISVFGNGALPVKGRAVTASMLAIVTEENLAAGTRELLKAGLDPVILKSMQLAPSPMVSQDLFNTISGYGYYTVPMVCIVIIQSVLLFGIGIAVGGWLDPAIRPAFFDEALKSTSSFLAVFAAFVFIAVFWGVFLEGMGLSLLGMPTLMNLGATLISVLFFSLSISALGFLIILLMGSNRYVVTLTLASAPSVFLTGMIYPMENFASWVIPFAWLLPSTPGCKAIVYASQEGAGIGHIFPYLAALAVQFAAYFSLMLFLVKNRQCRSDTADTNTP